MRAHVENAHGQTLWNLGVEPPLKGINRNLPFAFRTYRAPL